MKLSKNALGNLINRYTAVLKKCNLLNAFGSLTVATMLVLGGAVMTVAANLSGVNAVGQRTTITQPVGLLHSANLGTTSGLNAGDER